MKKISVIAVLLLLVGLALNGWWEVVLEPPFLLILLIASVMYSFHLSSRLDRISEQLQAFIALQSRPDVPVSSSEHPVVTGTLQIPDTHAAVSPSAPIITPTEASSHITQSPTWAIKLRQRLIAFLTEGNPFVRVGVIVMLIGLSFLVKYAANQQLLPLEVRLAGVILVGIIMIGIGWKTRYRPGGFGLVFQGGGIAAIYLTLFAAAKVFPVITPSVAFGLMLVIVALGVLLALLQNAQSLAVMATLGGFLTPILVGGDSRSPVGLFGFYLLLNLGVMAIAWFKSWRPLNWVAFTFTFAVFAFWAVFRYDPMYYAPTQAFTAIFFVLFLAIAVLFSFKQVPKLKGVVDGSLVFGLPLVVLALQARWFYETDYGVAVSAIVMAAVYIALAFGLFQRVRTTHHLLIESFIAIGVGLATLSIPLALNAQWTSASWAVEAVGLLWIGLRQNKSLARYAAYLLWLASLFALALVGVSAGETPLITGSWLNIALIASSAGALSWMLRRAESQSGTRESVIGELLAHLGWGLWCLGFYIDVDKHASSWAPGLWWLALGVSYFAVRFIQRRIDARPIELGWWLLGLAILGGMALWRGHDLLLANGGIIGLVVWIAAIYRYLADRDDRQHVSGRSTTWLHVVSVWFISMVVLLETKQWERVWGLDEAYGLVATTLGVILPLWVLFYGSHAWKWPFKQHPQAYVERGPLVGMGLLTLLFGFACGVSAVSPYVPMVNLVDLSHAFMVVTFIYAWRLKAGPFAWLPVNLSAAIIAVITFVWINVVMLRAIHHYAEVDYRLDALWASGLVQMALSILWISVALAAMSVSRRMSSRSLWMAGAVLLGLILLKLFTKDIANRGTLFQVISFMVVGGGIALIGYLAPIPAKLTPRTESSDQQNM